MNEYWERRYSDGGTSGVGSVGKAREWKWNRLLAYAGAMDDVIDVGCGDLRFWQGHSCENYLGIDISPTVLERNAREHPHWKFVLHDAETPVQGIAARIVICLDVLFHILDDSAYVRILENLCKYSKEWIFIGTWAKNPFGFGWRLKTLLFDVGAVMLRKHPSRFSRSRGSVSFLFKKSDTDELYQKYRDFTTYIPVLGKRGFAHVASHAMPTELDYYHHMNALHVFRRMGIERAL